MRPVRRGAVPVKLPEGFSASGVACGLKPSGSLDLGMIMSDRPAVSAGVFTTNRVQAAPLQVSRRHVRRGSARMIVVNAGNANACTGKQGLADARTMAKAAGKTQGVAEQQVLVASTGVIGVPMDMAAVARGITAAAAALGSHGSDDFASAIMTTDTVPKIASAALGDATIVGFAKGAGMIAPEMATMLCFIVTDAPVPRAVLAPALQAATSVSFNAISIDGCRSTNDCILVLANGAVGGDPIAPGSARAEAFATALRDVCQSLSRQIVEDGEGATKVVSISVRGATSAKEARKAAGTIADSVLLRCALNGADPNWGRVLAALGTSGIPFDPNRVDVWLGGEHVCAKGAVGPGDREKARHAMMRREVEIVVEMNRGAASATVLTNDLSAEYVRINAEYTT